jgi:hypothetical protein
VSGLPDVIARLERLASPEWTTELARRQSDRVLDLIDNGYRDKTNPYGEPWAPTKQKNPILERSGTFRRTWTPEKATSDGFSIVSGVLYGGFHQDGTAKIIPRKVIPDAERGLGNDGTAKIVPRKVIPDSERGLGKWQEPLDKIAVELALETMK